MTLLNRNTIPCPVTSFKQLRCRIQHTPQSTTCTPSMKDKDNLHKELQNELNTTGKLKNFILAYRISKRSPSTNNKSDNIGGVRLGKRGGDAIPAAHQPAAKAAKAPTQNQAINETNKGLIIKGPVNTVTLFQTKQKTDA